MCDNLSPALLSSRWIFNLIHGMAIGLVVEILACEISTTLHML